MVTAKIFSQEIQTLQAKRFCIAFSGGLDSMVLLQLFVECKQFVQDLTLRAIHVHHGLSNYADHWAEECKRFCQDIQIPLAIHHLPPRQESKMSTEEWARIERYQVLSKSLTEGEALVTGHHQNDQAETLLLQLFRGAGPKGLAAMPVMVPFGKGKLIRPLLNYQRSSLEQYAITKQLSWIEDDSNQNMRFDRNFLRHELFPIIEQRWPSITENLARAAKHCATAHHFIENQISSLFQHVFVKENGTLSIPLLLEFDVKTRNYLIRYWLKYLKFPLPSTQKLSALENEILHSRADAMPLVCWKEVEVRRYDGHLYAMSPLSTHCPNLIVKWDLTGELCLPNNLGMIKLDDLYQLDLNWGQFDQVTIRFRQGGERCRLKNRAHSSSLKKLFQEWRIPPWKRDRIPLLYSRDVLKAIIGFAACE